MIKAYAEMPEGEVTTPVGKPALRVLRMLMRNDLDYDWTLASHRINGSTVTIVVQTHDGKRVRRTVYEGPVSEMRLLIGALGWYRENAGDPSVRSRQTTEVCEAIDNPRINQRDLLAVLLERYEPFAGRVL